MELLEGKNLEEYLVQWEDKGHFFPLEHVGKIFEPVVHTLALAHKHGIVHRDLKPGNIYVMSAERGGGVRLLDFGLAKVMSAKPLTREGMVAGSPSFIAPEVWKGDPRKLDQRIDIYSLAALIFRVIAGRPPFMGSMLELMQLVLSAERPSLHALRSELPKDVDGWATKALAIAPGDRYQTIEEMWKGLTSVVPLK
jgi:serine/threonine-protein kinase